MKWLLIGLIRFYQKFLSPLKKNSCCRFTPTCSAYAIEALKKRGLVIGFILMWIRIFKCQPFGPCGWDPVPEKGLRNPKAIAKPMTKYFYPGEYGLERDVASKDQT
jgi:putative membrane protein insertion efficiency factor